MRIVSHLDPVQSTNLPSLETLGMTNDAKLGLAVGVALVITVAVVFFRKDTVPAHAAPSSINAPAVGTATNGVPSVEIRLEKSKSQERGAETVD